MAPKLIILCTLLFAVTATCATAQDTAKNNAKIPPAFWGEFGYGASSVGSFSGIVYVNAQITQKLIITGGLQGESNQPLSVINLSARHEVDLNSISLFIGKIYKQEYSMFIISAGLSYVQHQDLTTYGLFSATPAINQSKYVVGVPILIRGYWVLGQCIGLGAGLYGNFNTQQSSGGATLLLAFGRIQTHQPRHIKPRDPLHIFN